MRIWYKLVSKVFNYYEQRLTKDIPQDAVNLCTRYKIDLYEVRFNKAVLSVEQVNTVLKDARYDTMQRLVTKNILRQYNLMEEGYVYSELDAEYTGAVRRPEEENPKIWKHNPVCPPHMWIKTKEVPLEELKAMYPEYKQEGNTFDFTQPGTYTFNGTVNSTTVRSSYESKTSN